MSQTRRCPGCGQELVEDGRFWMCRDHGQPRDDSTPEPPASDPTGPPIAAAFISYGHADATELVARLMADLKKHNVDPVWLDSEMLLGGVRWSTGIEAGIRKADAVLAVMTPHALRHDSICQDEVAFASNEGKRVVPVRVDPDPSVRPSLLLVRRSWVDFTGDYDVALERLLRALTGDESGLVHPLHSVAGQHPKGFDAELARLRRGFVGREWLVARFEAWLAGDRGRAFVIHGEPGIGKSAIAARLAALPQCAAVHFCTTRDTDSLSPLGFIANVVVSLSARIEGFSALVEARHPEQPRPDDVTAFRQLVVEPAHALTPAPELTHFVVVDALDEAVSHQGQSIVDLVSAHADYLPGWLRLVATTRPEVGILQRLEAFAPVSLEASSADNLGDVEVFVKQRLGESALTTRIADPEAAIATITARAAGNFLYADRVLLALEEGPLSEHDLDRLPKQLTGLYHEMLRAEWPDLDVYHRDVAPVLGCLCASLAPVPRATLSAATGLAPTTLDSRLIALSQFLRVDGHGRDAAFSLYHRSMAEWLRSDDFGQIYSVDVTAGHEMLSDALVAESQRSEYAVRWLGRHLAVLERWEELAALLGDLSLLKLLWAYDKFEVLRLLARLNEAGIPVTDVWAAVLASPESYEPSELRPLPQSLRNFRYIGEARELAKHVVIRLRTAAGPDRADLAWWLNRLAASYRVLNDYDSAYELLVEAEAIYRELGDADGLQETMNNRALILMRRRQLEDALVVFNETEAICRELNLWESLESSIFNQATVWRRRGATRRAAELYRYAEELSLACGNAGRLRNVLRAQSRVARFRGHLRESIALNAERQRLCEEVGARAAMLIGVRFEAECEMDQEAYAAAAATLHRALKLADERTIREDQVELLAARARLLRETGSPADALDLLAAHQGIDASRLSDEERLGLGVRTAEALVDLGRPDEALEVLAECEGLPAAAREPELTLQFLLIRTKAYDGADYAECARESLAAAEAMARDTEAARYLGIALEAKARQLLTSGDRETALAAAMESLALAESMGASLSAARRRALVDDIGGGGSES